MINKNNYEIYAIDYLEGKLPPELQKEFESFLAANPDIKEELQLMENIEIDKPEQTYDYKSSLKKSDYEQYGISYFEQLCIENIEGIIPEDRKRELADAIENNNDMLAEYKLYAETKLVPDSSVKYPYKNKLKKGKVIDFGKILHETMRAAAAIALLFGVFTVIKSDFKAKLIAASLAKNEVIFAQTALDVFVPDIIRPVNYYDNSDPNTRENTYEAVAINKSKTKTKVVKKEKIVTYEEVIVIPSKSIENDFRSLVHLPPKVDDLSLNSSSIAGKPVKVKISDANSFAIETIKKIGGDKVQIEKHKVIIKINDKAYGIYSSRGFFR